MRTLSPFALALPLLLCLAAAPAGEPAGYSAAAAPLEVPDLFDPASAKRPKAGEWLEYLVAIPVDPLENSLAPKPIPPPAAALPGEPAQEYPYQAAFNPPRAWRTLPLRLVVRRIGDDSCQAAVTFAGETRELTLPLAPEPAGAAFRYPAPQPTDRKTVHNLNGRPVEVEITRRQGNGYGFVRLSGPDIPFGLARFASENLDLILVGAGHGTPPPFPLAVNGGVNPPPGLLYVTEEGKGGS